jgi:ATP-dependent Lhr-like helicase
LKVTGKVSGTVLELFHPAVREWFSGAFSSPTLPQQLGWPTIARGDSTLILAPTGSGKTLAAFLWCLNRLMVEPPPDPRHRCRVLYISPLKALAVDVERNLRAPLSGIAGVAAAHGVAMTVPEIAIRTGDTPPRERARFLRSPTDILITTPESLFLLLTSNARERLAAVDTVIIDEIHALVPGKRGAHLALSLERLEALRQGPAKAGHYVPEERQRPPEGGHDVPENAGSGVPERVGSGVPEKVESGVSDNVVSGFSRTLQRIGLSATQRPLDEVARFLGGALTRTGGTGPATGPRRRDADTDLQHEFGDDAAPVAYRPVSIVDAAEKKPLALRIEVPVDEMARTRSDRSGRLKDSTESRSIWSSIHPRLLELIGSHRSTLLFVNSRRLAERLAGALNDLALLRERSGGQALLRDSSGGQAGTLVRAHHGSLSHGARVEVEDLLKAGQIRALVATSSLELGIDMGAIDLVVQIEAPPSVASGLQRIGRAGHQAGATSEGVIFPKFRGDLVACAAVARAMHEGQVESTRYPRNPLDVLAQQIVAMAGVEQWDVDDLFSTIRRAAPFANLSRRMFEGVLDMLSGRYPSDEFAELRPRVTWDRVRNTIAGREGAKRVAIANAGTIPDRGLYGVFLAGADKPVRVGELDEEMVFETPVGETFTLGASTWRVEEITHDRVLVSPAPGEPGKMPFWHGDQAGRPVELGMAIGALVRELRAVPRAAAIARLVGQHDLETPAAEHLLRYLDDQALAGAVPDDRTIVIERCIDELGCWRVCLLSALGSRIHAPWAMAATARIRSRTGIDVEVLWGDDGFVVRFPELESPPDPSLLLPEPDEVTDLVTRHLGSTSLFAARFREAAARALLLPRRRPGARTPLWLQRKRAANLLAVAARFGSFPVLLETYREILRDHFDMPALVDTLRRVSTGSSLDAGQAASLAGRGTLAVRIVDSRTPSPFAASLLFNYVANYIYDGDAPLAERRAHALSVDQTQLHALLGDAELRELLDAGALSGLERQLQHLAERSRVRHADGLHDLLIRIGDLTIDEIQARSAIADTHAAVAALKGALRIVALEVAGHERYVAVEDVARYRDGLGVSLPPGLPDALLEPVQDPAGDLVLRYARSHGPFTAGELAARFGLDPATAGALLQRLTTARRIVEGAFRPGGTDREWIDGDVLQSVRRRSLAKLREEIEPVDADALGRFMVSWHGIGSGRRGPETVLDAIEQLQGAGVPASLLETQILPARVEDYHPGMLDTLMAAGEVVWTGVEPLGERDGRITLYLADHAGRLRAPGSGLGEKPQGRAGDILEYLGHHGASFFSAIHQGTGGGFPQEAVDALWALVWNGLVTNDTLHPLRAYVRPPEARTAGRPRHATGGGPPASAFKSRRLIPPTAEGRWALVGGATGVTTSTGWAAATAQQLLARHGIVARETMASEAVAGGFAVVYQVLTAMEQAGKVRRGYFVAGLGGAQFAMPAALEMLRAVRDRPAEPNTVVLAATDPANPFGTVLKWPAAATEPDTPPAGRGAVRSVGALVILVDGSGAAYLRRGERELLLNTPEAEPCRSRVALEVALMLLRLASARNEDRRGMLIAEINGEPAATHPQAGAFVEAGFHVTAMGLQAKPAKR